MKQVLNEELKLFYYSNFPKVLNKNSKKTYEVIIGIGGNIGKVKQRFDKLLLNLKANKRFDVIQTSPLLLNPAFGFKEQEDFLNAVIVLKTDLYVREFFKLMQKIELRFKRQRTFKNAPRTLDIDIIFFGNKKIKTKDLQIPHIAWSKRASVIIPLQRIKKCPKKY